MAHRLPGEALRVVLIPWQGLSWTLAWATRLPRKRGEPVKPNLDVHEKSNSLICFRVSLRGQDVEFSTLTEHDPQTDACSLPPRRVWTITIWEEKKHVRSLGASQ